MFLVVQCCVLILTFLLRMAIVALCSHQNREAYFMWRQMQLEDVGLLCNLTKRLSQPLSILWALERLIPREELSDMTSLTVHVLGASAFEVPADSGGWLLIRCAAGVRLVM